MFGEGLTVGSASIAKIGTFGDGGEEKKSNFVRPHCLYMCLKPPRHFNLSEQLSHCERSAMQSNWPRNPTNL